MMNINLNSRGIKANIYQIIQEKKVSNEEKERLICNFFKENISNIRNVSRIDEFNKPMEFAIIYQFIKTDILYLLSECNKLSDKEYILSQQYMDIKWNEYIFNLFIKLKSKDNLLWFFFHVPYFISNKFIKNIEKYREIYNYMINYSLKNWPDNLFFNEKDFLFISAGTWLPYPLVYHNKNNKDILINYCKLIRKICPWVNYASPRVNFKNRGHYSSFINSLNNEIDCVDSEIDCKKIKIAFISDSFNRDSCVLKDRIGIIGKLSKKFTIYICSFNKYNTISGEIAPLMMKLLKDNYIHLGDNLQTARSRLEDLDCDIIIYPDLGMKYKTTLLAFSRLAPIQITTWGHSETSGINTIDYYISSKYFHHNYNRLDTTIDNIDNLSRIENVNFSEKLILLNSLSTYYFRPSTLFLDVIEKDYENIKNIDDNDENNMKELMSVRLSVKGFKSRKHFNLEDKHNVYGCLQTFYKLNYEFELMLNQILIKDPNAIILLSNVVPYCKSHLIRLKNIFGININRLKWMPSLSIKDYLNVVSLCDVILDTYPFGGCNTSFESFDLNIPVITMSSKYLNGNFTSGLYKKMGILDCIATSKEEYINLALLVVNNIKVRHKIERKIDYNKDKIFEDYESVTDYQNLILKLLSSH
jgi:hypothetical protein